MSMKKLLLPVVLVLMFDSLMAQLPSYDVASIPEAIKKNASVIKRYENVYFEITDIDRAYLKRHRVYTVMNEDGAGMLTFAVSSDKFSILEDAEIKVYDASGKQVNKYKKKDLATIAISDGLI